MLSTSFLFVWRKLAVLLTTVGILIVSSTICQSADLVVGNFSTEGLSGWDAKSFKGFTQYQLVRENNRTVVRAISHNAASGLVKKVSFDPGKHRYLRWSWKVDHTIPKGDEKTKAGDDYAARVYIVFPGRYFWQMKAINYIWANKLAKGSSAPSVYAGESRMVAVESGNSKTGQWISEERDLLTDYRMLFGTDPPEAEAIAIMTDTDNTGGVAEAWYGNIIISTEK